MAVHVSRSNEPLDSAKLWGTMKLESNGVRTTLIHALMHTRGMIARPWRRDLMLGAVETADGVNIVMKADSDWSGRLVFDRPRYRVYMGFNKNWPRMNTLPEWFTVEADEQYMLTNLTTGDETSHTGKLLHKGVSVQIPAGVEVRLQLRPAEH